MRRQRAGEHQLPPFADASARSRGVASLTKANGPASVSAASRRGHVVRLAGFFCCGVASGKLSDSRGLPPARERVGHGELGHADGEAVQPRGIAARLVGMARRTSARCKVTPLLSGVMHRGSAASHLRDWRVNVPARSVAKLRQDVARVCEPVAGQVRGRLESARGRRARRRTSRCRRPARASPGLRAGRRDASGPWLAQTSGQAFRALACRMVLRPAIFCLYVGERNRGRVAVTKHAVVGQIDTFIGSAHPRPPRRTRRRAGGIAAPLGRT